MSRARGFTLIEVLIAMAITAFIAAAAYAGVTNVIIGAEQLRENGDRTREISRALDLIGRDLRQFIERPVRDEFGNWQPALSGGPLAPYPLSLTRDGWHNSLGLPRSDLQRVHYYLEDGALWRAYNVTLDRSINVNLQRVLLLEGVESLELRFLESLDSLQVSNDLVIDTQNWAPSWVAEPGASLTAMPLPPVALELRLELEDFGELRSLHELPQR
ncbi:MAG: type II secretion system minor pseudopilin GspJ [Halieaceae bacterium]|jgi:general secretion pathway protein J|nr:type II secretion system minor pseudopilin GspJ [Halieaceae bacterium]